MCTDFYTKYTMPCILTEKKAKQTYFLHRQQLRLYQLDIVLCFTIRTHRWLGFRFLIFPCSLFYLLTGGPSATNQIWYWKHGERKERKKYKRNSAVSVLYTSVYIATSEGAYAACNIYTSPIYSKMLGFTPNCIIWEGKQNEQTKTLHWTKANPLIWRQMSNTCLKL